MAAPRTPTRGGFTLLEMLLTTLLTAVLMVGIWSLSTLYVALFESGRDQTQETQLVRSLEQQFSDDLLAAIQVPGKDASPSPAPTLTESTMSSETISTASSADETDADDSAADEFSRLAFVTFTTLPRFGLIGTERSMQLTILRATPPPLEQDVVDETDEVLEPRAIVHAPELRVVLYSFEEPYEPDPNDRRPPAGLLRRELAWETARGLAGTDDESMFAESFFRNAASSPLAADGPELTAAEEEQLDDDEPVDEIVDESLTLVPEVVAMEFRYFDGRTWSSQWDSRIQKTLPVAVEIAVEVMSAEELDELLDDSFLEDEDEEPLDLDQETDAIDEQEEPRGRIYRRLIFLPASARPGYGAFNRGFSPGATMRTRP